MAKRKRHQKKKKLAPPAAQFAIGEVVAVREGILYPDHGAPIGGWRGRITGVSSEGGKSYVMLQWDSITLRAMPAEMIIASEQDGLDWSTFGLEADEVEAAEGRDRQEDVQAAIAEIGAQYRWAFLGEQGMRIQAALGDARPGDDWAAFEAWQYHLAERLVFPFQARVSEFQERGSLQAGDKVRVLGINTIIDGYGLIVDIRAAGRTYQFPLCDLEAPNQQSPNYLPVNDYAVWFANR